MNTDPFLDPIDRVAQRTTIFVALWLVSFGLLCWYFSSRFGISLEQWWDLFSAVLDYPDCPRKVMRTFALLAVISATPVVEIFWLVWDWQHHRGIHALGKSAGTR